MAITGIGRHLPDYQIFTHSIALLSIPISSSELHGIMCGYLCADASYQGEAYLQALMIGSPSDGKRDALSIIFEVYTISQQQIANLDFEFQLMLPNDDDSLMNRAQAFGLWCAGFTEGLTMAGIDPLQVEEDEIQEAIQHLAEFAQLDYESLEMEEQDEKAFVDVSEYTRMAVLRIYNEIKKDGVGSISMDTTH